MKRLQKIKKEASNILYRNCLLQAILCSILGIIFGPSSVILIIFYPSSVIYWIMVAIGLLFVILAIVLWISFVKYYICLKSLLKLKTSYSTSKIINCCKLSFVYNIYSNKITSFFDIAGVIITDDKNNKYIFILNCYLHINKKNKQKLKQQLLKKISAEVYYKSNVIESVKELSLY